ncbi:MAG: TonB-dependent receptor family protein [Bryobacterales bacterium]|nr:TonB-dependent receptor family protein [Bryobacterales bacterium]
MKENRVLRFHRKLSAGLLLTMFLIAATQQTGKAQVLYGSIVGSVTDSSGAAIQGAEVKVTQKETNETREATTNEAGGYTLSTVVAGTYTVSISKIGFRTFVTQNALVRLNTVVRVDAALEIGAQTQEVLITAQSAELQTDRADVHAEFATKSIVDLPQPTRTYQGVLALIPGFAPPVASTGGTNNPGRSMQLSANGTSRSGTSVRVDGVSVTNPWVQFFTSSVPSIDAIQTVSVVTGSADAEQGMANGASINVQMKSGTNAIHGSLFEYNETSGLKARPFFQPANQRLPKLVDNDLGGTVGGPLLKDKLFYFGSYEGDFLRTGSNPTFATVPTNDIRTGNMSASPTPIYDPSTGNPDGTGRTPFAGNIIPPNRISPISAKLVALVPQPNVPNLLANNYFVNTPNSYDLQKIDAKIDFNATSKLRFAGHLGWQPYNDVTATVFGDTLGGSNNHIQTGNATSDSIQVNYLVSPTFVVDGIFGITRLHQLLSPPLTDVKYGSDVLGIPGTNLGTLPHAGGLPQFNVSNYSGYGYSYPPLEYNDPVFQYTVNASKIKGAHNVRFGVDISQQHMNHFEVTPTSFSFSGGVTSLNGGPSSNQFNSYADFLLGLPNAVANSALLTPTITLRTWQYSLYVRDQWQVNRKLTVSYGTGWEYYPVPTRADRGIERYDLATNQYLICGLGSTPTDCGVNVQKTLFSPRIGFAYRPSETFVIRAGYSLNPEQINMARDGILNYPNTLTYNGSGLNSYTPFGPLSAGIPVLQTPDISKGVIPLPSGATFTTLPKDFTRGYTESMNFTLQKEIGRGWVAQAAYVGSLTIHQHTRYNVNYGQIGGGAASQPYYQLNGTSGAVTVVLPFETQHYNSFQGSLEHRFANGFQFQLAYTREKWMYTCCDDSGDGGPAIPIPQYTRLNRSLASADRPDNFRVSSLYELPIGKGKMLLSNGGLLGSIVGGWQLNAIFTHYSGSPFNVSSSGTSLNAPGSSQRADQIKQNVVTLGGVGSTGPWFDPLAYAPVTTARFGTAGFNAIRGPGVTNLDMSVFRDFKIRERFSMQIRGEALNASNTPHFSNPGANVSTLQLNPDGSVKSLNGFAQITSVNPSSRTIDERYFRLGVHIKF